MEVNGIQCCLVPNTPQNILWCVPEERKSYRFGTTWVNNDRFHFWVECSFNFNMKIFCTWTMTTERSSFRGGVFLNICTCFLLFYLYKAVKLLTSWMEVTDQPMLTFACTKKKKISHILRQNGFVKKCPSQLCVSTFLLLLIEHMWINIVFSSSEIHWNPVMESFRAYQD